MAVTRFLVPGLLLCCSCITVSLGGRSEPPVIYEVNPPPPSRASAVSEAVLRISDFTSLATYDRTDMVLVDSTGRVTRTAGHRWASTPTSILADLLARDVLAESRFEPVYRRSTPYSEDLCLDIHIREFGSRWIEGVWAACIETDVTVLDAGSGTIAFQGTLRMTEPIASGGFDELASAMGVLAGRWSSEIRAELAGILETR